jgi:hypothetical protein
MPPIAVDDDARIIIAPSFLPFRCKLAASSLVAAKGGAHQVGWKNEG